MAPFPGSATRVSANHSAPFKSPVGPTLVLFPPPVFTFIDLSSPTSSLRRLFSRCCRTEGASFRSMFGLGVARDRGEVEKGEKDEEKMYGWRVSMAVTLGLLWYFTDSGRALAQYFVCFFFFCLSTPLLLADSGRESSTQTDEDALQETLDEHFSSDLTAEGNDNDTGGSLGCHYPRAKRSLQQVFQCAYARLVLPWYDVPEPCERQPLHQALSREFDFVIDSVIQHTRDLDVCQAVVGSIRILTQHLHDAKHPDRQLFLRCRAEEIALLRELSDALVRNLLPEQLWGQQVTRCALSEIVALKGLGLLVTWLSDPDNLNQLVVSQLDSVSAKGSTEELRASDPERASLDSQEDDSAQVNLEGVEVSTSSQIKGKGKGNKLKAGWSKFVDKMKTKKAKKKKMKKLERELVMRIMAARGDASNEDEASSREGSVHSQHDSDREDSDLENYLTSVQEDMMEFKLSYEMWRVGRWAVSIPHAEWENEELIFTVHLEERDSPENLQWDIKKKYMDVIYFRNRWQDSTSLPSILEVNELEVSNETKEEAKVSVEHFLQELISDTLIGHTQPVFQFLCPLDKLLNEEQHYGGVWGLLSGLAYFLTPGQEDEESSTPPTGASKEIIMSTEGSENSLGSTETSCAVRTVSLPTVVISSCETPKADNMETEKEPSSSLSSDSSVGNCCQDKAEDSDNPLMHFKMIIRGLTRSRSQESLTSTKNQSDEDPSLSDYAPTCSREGGNHGEDAANGPSWLHFNARAKKEKTSPRVSCGTTKSKGKEQVVAARGDEPPCARSQGTWEQLEATKAIFDLLKEISGNSILINIFDAILKPVMPILKKKVNSFLNKMNPSETQMAAYIQTLCDKAWPQTPAATSPQPPPRTEDEKSETRERAHNLISARYSHYLVLKKTDMENVFNLFQDAEKNKALVYMLLSFLLRELFPDDHSLNRSAAALQNVTNLIA
ncbi:uncharacterized protein si:rp71-46j2.7 [Phycodurus eques]|uniref:uncharacterized protein si:rp71-46j2.7 n=1 Tax=Phycodurus eques TaxID=693459 RepID=UPI002ACD6C46|nr:uncharacterized protein si:rp71-46j2.7 [Phycodurus eques]